MNSFDVCVVGQIVKDYNFLSVKGKKFVKYALKKDNPKIPKKLRATYWITQIFLPRNIKKYLVK